MRSSAVLQRFVFVVGAVAAMACTPAEDQVIARHPPRQLIVQSGKVESSEPATEATLSRGKYRGGREIATMSRTSSAALARPVAVFRAHPAPPPRH